MHNKPLFELNRQIEKQFVLNNNCSLTKNTQNPFNSTGIFLENLYSHESLANLICTIQEFTIKHTKKILWLIESKHQTNWKRNNKTVKMINGLTRARAYHFHWPYIPYKSAIIFSFRLCSMLRINLGVVLSILPVVDDYYYYYLLYAQLLDAYVFMGFNVINHCKLHFCRVCCVLSVPSVVMQKFEQNQLWDALKVLLFYTSLWKPYRKQSKCTQILLNCNNFCKYSIREYWCTCAKLFTHTHTRTLHIKCQQHLHRA